MGSQSFFDGLLLGFPEAFDDDVDATEILQAQVAHKDLLDTLAQSGSGFLDLALGVHL